MKKTISILLALVLAIGVCSAFAEKAALPVYSFHGDDDVTAAVVKYMQESNEAYDVPEDGVLIPTPIVLKTEVSEDGNKATVWGNFWIFVYKLNGKILDLVSGGENPGVITLEKKDGEWTVVSAEFAGDGEEYQKSIEKFANGDEKLLESYALTVGDDGFLPQYQRAVLVEYVNDNGLEIEAYQEPGWDPVSLTD